MKKPMQLTVTLLLFLSISACGSAHKDLTAPCPNYGRHCPQTPINSWDYSHR